MPAIKLRKERGRSWLARITGKDAQYGLARRFVPASMQDADFGTYLIDEGHLYQYQSPGGGRQFMTWRAGEFTGIPEEEALAWVERLHKGTPRGQIDEALERLNAAPEEEEGKVRFNAEGGFTVEPSDN